MRALHPPLFLAALLASAVAVPALAQTASPPLTSYAACTTSPSKQDSEQAHSAFLLGKRFFDEADYGSAIHNFVDAYKLDCTKPELLTIIARANELNGSRPEAVHALETYLQRAQSIGADEKTQIQKRIDNLKAQIAAQQPIATPSAPTPPPTAPVATVPPAPHDTPPVVAPLPAPPLSTSHSVAPWIVFGLGAVAVVTAIPLVIVGHSKVIDGQNIAKGDHCTLTTSSCPPGVDTSAFNDKITSGNTLLDVGWVVGGVGAAAVIGGLLWHFLEPTGPASAADVRGGAQGGVRAELVPVVAPNSSGLSLVGTF